MGSSSKDRGGCALSNPAEAPCLSVPTGLADGLGLESTPVRRSDLRPEEPAEAGSLVPPLPRQAAQDEASLAADYRESFAAGKAQSTAFMAIGTDAVDELENLRVTIAKEFPRAVFFAGQLVFQRDTWYQRLLHNETAYSLQRRLQWDGVPMIILPTRAR